jgi:hypothetical protein
MSVGSLAFNLGYSSPHYLSPTSVPNTNLQLPTDFTIDFFCKCPSPTYSAMTITNGNYGPSDWSAISVSYVGYQTNLWYGGGVYFYGTTNVQDNQWHFVTIQRSGTTYSIYVDGVLDVQQTKAVVNLRFDTNIILGGYINSAVTTNSYNGYLSNLRIVKGTALYTGNFTPPTKNLTAVSGTELLLNMAYNAPFIDSSPNNILFSSARPPTASTDSPVSPVTNVVCFKENSKIVCLVNGREKDMFVQDIRNGVLVKTLLNGYIPVCMIGTSKIDNPGHSERIVDRLYLCKKEMFPGLNEDLIITGNHAILVDELNDNEFKLTMEKLGKVYVTDNKYRLLACIDSRAIPYDVAGEHNIYHIALENDAYLGNYGIYANGLLVESCSKRFLKELSNMTLL